MTVKEIMQKIIAEDIGDIDFCDDHDERANIAYCGNHWSAKAEEKYAHAFALPIDEASTRLEGKYPIIIVHCETGKDASALADLLYAMAGYIDEEEYDELFPEPEEPEPEPQKAIVAIVMKNGDIIKGTKAEIDNDYIDVLRLDGDWYSYKIANVLRIVGGVTG